MAGMLAISSSDDVLEAAHLSHAYIIQHLHCVSHQVGLTLAPLALLVPSSQWHPQLDCSFSLPACKALPGAVR